VQNYCVYLISVTVVLSPKFLQWLSKAGSDPQEKVLAASFAARHVLLHPHVFHPHVPRVLHPLYDNLPKQRPKAEKIAALRGSHSNDVTNGTECLKQFNGLNRALFLRTMLGINVVWEKSIVLAWCSLTTRKCSGTT